MRAGVDSLSERDSVLEIELPDDELLRERIEAALYLLDCSGSVISVRDGRTILSAYFPDAATRESAQAHLVGEIPSLHAGNLDPERVDWLRLYQQSLVAIPVGTRFLVAPDPLLLNEPGGRIPLVVPQERAFGTGSHPTTSMCLELLETLADGRHRGLDIGTGSGILAIGMRKLGVAQVFAFDNDPDALGVLTDNLRRNGMGDHEIRQFFGGVECLRRGEFDLVTMNIIPEVIIPLLSQVRALLAPDASVILSGILLERAGDVRAAAATHGLTFESAVDDGEWWAGHFVYAAANGPDQ